MIRLFNISVSLILIFIFLIPFVIILTAVKLTSKGPAIHWSKRIGKNNTIFLMPKFRTMKINTPQVATHLLMNSNNFLTSIGGFLRKSSLDELPQLWSIFVGDMNLVGPRPALFNQDDLISLRTENNIHIIAPGLTGWAQINGRDELSIQDKVQLDRFYVARRSLWFDIKILFSTIFKVLMRRDITH